MQFHSSFQNISLWSSVQNLCDQMFHFSHQETVKTILSCKKTPILSEIPCSKVSSSCNPSPNVLSFHTQQKKLGICQFVTFYPKFRETPGIIWDQKHNNRTQVLTKHLTTRGNTRCWANAMGNLFSLCICLSFQIFPTLDIFHLFF